MLKGKRKLVAFGLSLVSISGLAWLGVEPSWGGWIVGLFASFAAGNVIKAKHKKVDAPKEKP